jgi:lipopolysaccharide/colanic/teichoic acid biosynthesis glycosyltransferase
MSMTGLSESRRLPHRLHRWSTQKLGYEVAKRTIDVIISLAAIVILAPLLAALCLLVRWTSPGPALFRQERLGRGSRPFTMLKLRTMRCGTSDELHREFVTNLAASSGQAASAGPRGLSKLETDPRVTPPGLWLRRMSLDELPQLFNVLAGKMSLVGPRPVLAWEAQLWPQTYPAYSHRFAVKPGLTGLWQVSGRGRLSVEEWIELDAEYVRRRGLGLDLLILLRTGPALLSGGTA